MGSVISRGNKISICRRIMARILRCSSSGPDSFLASKHCVCATLRCDYSRHATCIALAFPRSSNAASANIGFLLREGAMRTLDRWLISANLKILIARDADRTLETSQKTVIHPCVGCVSIFLPNALHCGMDLIR